MCVEGSTSNLRLTYLVCYIVSRLLAASETYKMELLLDVNTQLYPVRTSTLGSSPRLASLHTRQQAVECSLSVVRTLNSGGGAHVHMRKLRAALDSRHELHETGR